MYRKNKKGNYVPIRAGSQTGGVKVRGKAVMAITITHAKVIFSLQNEILEAPELSDTRKVEMLKNSIKNTIGNKTDIEEKK